MWFLVFFAYFMQKLFRYFEKVSMVIEYTDRKLNFKME